MSTGLDTLAEPRLPVRAPRAERRRANGLVVSALGCAAFIGVLIPYSDVLLHWFIVPVFLCGVVIGRDAVDWVRCRLDAFDPVGIVGLVGVHFFFVAPMLHVAWDYWMRDVATPQDWRDWLGGMAILNLLGLVLYRACTSRRMASVPRSLEPTAWLLRGKRYYLVLIATLLATGALQVWVYSRFGGILGYIESYAGRENPFKGMGWIFTISESFPIVAMIGFATLAKKRPTLKTWPILVLAIVTFFIVQMLFGGLRGSRSNTVWAMFWAVGIVHLTVRAVPRKVIYAGVTLLVLFMHLYGFYKGAGLDALSALQGSEARADLENLTGRTFQGGVLGDLARSDVQAYVLHRLWPVPDDYDYAWGRTYLGAVALLIPQSIWPDRPPTKVKEGTEAQYGMGSYNPGVFQSSRVYGLAGEAMLNFGPFVVPLAFAVLGTGVRYLRRWRAELPSGDARLMLYPMLVNLCFVILSSDSDNILFFITNNATVPFLVVWLGSRRTARGDRSRHSFGPLPIGPV